MTPQERRELARACAQAIDAKIPNDLKPQDRALLGISIAGLVDGYMAMMLNPPTKRLSLPDVTLVAAADAQTGLLMEAALRECSRLVAFGNAIIMQIEVKSLADWSNAIWYEIPRALETSHMLVIQYDSWVVNAGAWRNDWLQYDYIGAPWYWHPEGSNVGNGGFSLRSKRLMNFLGVNRQLMPCAEPEDDVLCRRYRQRLEAEGFRFAPTEVAAAFSFERSPPNGAFGFHGMYNWPHVLSDADIEARLSIAPPYVLNSLHCAQMREVMEQRR